MKCLCNLHCKILKEVDMFGKEPEFYYKKKSKKTSWIGRIFSFVFVIIYFAFFIYKLVRMLKKVDVTFYDTFTYEPEPPAINITNKNFYVGFGLEDPITYDVFMDEGIYIPKAYFKRAEKQGDDFEWQVKELELEPCKLEKFGSVYQEKFKNKELNNYYCFKEVDFILEGHFSYDLYSFFYIQFFPCVNTSNKHDCKPLEEIDYYLKNTFVSFRFQDIELTPNNYKIPIRPKDADIYTTVGKKLFKEIHAFFQLVDIQTDMDWIGFDEFENIKSEIYLKYDEMDIMTNIIEDNIYETGESFCDFTIKLSENVRKERRTYTKLISILGDVGGLMEVVFTIFRIISSFSIDILYEISLVNNLFSFDLNNKAIILKEKKNILKKIDYPFDRDEESKTNNSINSSKKIFSNNSFMSDDINNGTGNRFIEEIKIHDENSSDFKFTKKNSDIKGKFKYIPNDSNNSIIFYPKKKDNNQLTNNADNKENSYYIDNQKENQQQKRIVINKIKISRFCVYLCFCFTRKRNIIQNILLDEGMKIINEKLDIFNIFEKMYRYDEKKIINKKIFEMSNNSKIKIYNIVNKNFLN